MSEVEHTGRLLVASPVLAGSSTFAGAVVLLLNHDEEGALGVVINRPTPLRVEEVLPTWQGYTTGPGLVFQGGPVALDSALALASVPGGDEPLGWRRVSGALGLVDLDAPPELLAAEMAAMRVFAGYAGWGPGQLEGELAQGAWYLVAAEPEDAFTPTPTALWRAVLRRQRGSLALVSTYPEDPSHN